MAIESDYFLLLDDKSKQRNKLKNENIQGYDAPQVKKKAFSGDASKVPPTTDPDIVNLFLF